MRRMTNTFFIFTAFLAAISVASCNETPTPADPEIPDDNDGKDTVEVVAEIQDKDIEGYFKASLSGADSLFGGNYKIRTDSVAENRDRVWGLWKEANGDFMEDKLPTPDDLVTSHEASHWTLPAELEPNAIMPFHYGTKGSAPGDKATACEWASGILICVHTPA